jgi:ubiquinone biosynthesis protein
LQAIVRVFAKHGFHNVAERIKLGKFIIERLNSTEELERLSMAERVRMSFEELGPTFVKFGQVLATRPDLVPDHFTVEFEKLHDQVKPLSFEVVEAVLVEEFGNRLYEIFESIDPQPLGSASIAQVHKAFLKNGEPIVLKVQRPGIINIINDDLNVLYFLAELLDKYIPELQNFNPTAMVDEFFKTLEFETNFIVEANNIRRFDKNFAEQSNIKIPKVYTDYTTERVLVMEAFVGIPLSSDRDLHMRGIDPNEIVKLGLKAYLQMVFVDGLFHGDLHAGNFFVLGKNEIGLIDFGVVGRLNPKTQSAIANMLLALSKEDYERLAYEYVDLAPFTDQVNIDHFARDLRNLIAPYFGLTLKNVNLGKILMSTSAIASHHKLSVPAELMLFFKSLVSIEGLGRKLIVDFDFLKYSLEFATEIIKNQYEPNRMINDAGQLAREAKSFFNTLPRQLHFLIRKLNAPEHTFKLKVTGFEEIKKAIESSFNLLFLGIIIGSLILSASFLSVHESPNHMWGLPTISFAGYLIAAILSIAAFVNYIKK